MYESFFGLSNRPFSATPDVHCFFAADSTQAALEKLSQGVQRGLQIGLLVAPAGSGKTLLCQQLLTRFPDTRKSVLLTNSNFNGPRSLLQSLLFELNQPYSQKDEQELRLELNQVVQQNYEDNRRLLIILDEAHLLETELFEELRTLTDLTADGLPLVQVVLSGQLPLEERLAQPELQSFNQRIENLVYIENLTQQESREYIDFRLNWAGGDVQQIFTEDALQIILQASDGVPRCLNQLCDHSLLLGFVAEEKPVQPTTVREALEDLKQLPLQWNDPVSTGEELPDEELPVQIAASHRESGEKQPVGFDEAASSAPPEWLTSGEFTDLSGGASIEVGAGPELSEEFTESSHPSDRQPDRQLEVDPPALRQPTAQDVNSPTAEVEHQFHPTQPAPENPGAIETIATVPQWGEPKMEFQEEFVIDLYAALDAGFDGPRRPESKTNASPINSPRVGSQSKAAQPLPTTLASPRPSEPADSSAFGDSPSLEFVASEQRGIDTLFSRQQPDEILDDVIPLVESALNDELDEESVLLPPGATSNGVAQAVQNAVAAQTNATTQHTSRSSIAPSSAPMSEFSQVVGVGLGDGMTFEEEIISDVLEVCATTTQILDSLEIRNSSRESVEQRNTVAATVGGASHSAGPLPNGHGYDVVQPESGGEGAASEGGFSQSPPQDEPAFKRLFSQLRRRQLRA